MKRGTCSTFDYRDALRAGKRLLKEKNGAASMVRFEKALMLSKALSDRVGLRHSMTHSCMRRNLFYLLSPYPQVQERRANRGLAAAARLQGQYKTAIKNLVLAKRDKA